MQDLVDAANITVLVNSAKIAELFDRIAKPGNTFPPRTANVFIHRVETPASEVILDFLIGQNGGPIRAAISDFSAAATVPDKK